MISGKVHLGTRMSQRKKERTGKNLTKGTSVLE